jgi:hypothetical protein
MPPNPKIAAMIAITRKIIIQRTIILSVLMISISLRYATNILAKECLSNI